MRELLRKEGKSKPFKRDLEKKLSSPEIERSSRKKLITIFT